MSRSINFVLGATALVAGSVAYRLYRELEKQKTSSSSSQALLTSSQALLPKPGQTSYAQMRLFYTPPMVRAWSPTYSGGVTDADLYAEAQRVYKLQLENAEPKDAWDRDGDIETPLPPPRDALPFGDELPLEDDLFNASSQESSGDFDGGVRRRRMIQPDAFDFDGELPIGVDSRRMRDVQIDFSGLKAGLNYQRRKQEFESKYEGTYEEYLAAQKEARRTGRVIFPTPRRQYIDV